MSAALMVAAAASDTEEDRGEGDWLYILSEDAGKLRRCSGEEEEERDRERELRSGGIVVSYFLT